MIVGAIGNGLRAAGWVVGDPPMARVINPGTRAGIEGSPAHPLPSNPG